MKIVFLLTFAVLAAADVSDTSEEEDSAAVETLTSELSEEDSAAVSSAESPTMTLLKTKISCLNNQLRVCERLLTTTSRNCKHRKLVNNNNLSWTRDF